MTGTRYLTPTAFRNAVTVRLKEAARARGRPLGEVRREFVFHRYRDLVDLVLIVGSCRIAGSLAGEALRAEAHRRGLVLPSELVAPGPDWSAGYRVVAGSAGLGAPVDQLDGALAAVNECLRPVLASPVGPGEWDPARRRWLAAGGSAR